MPDTNVSYTTVYDDVFRTMLEKTPKLIIFLINEIFSENYSATEKVTLLQNEFLTESEKLITDSYLKIGDKYYHIECQSNPDGSMAIRMIEYDFMIALRNAEKDGYHYNIKYPHSAVLYLRHNRKTPDRITVNVEFPSGERLSYYTPIIKVQDYDLKKVFDKKLLAFLPYYILRYEKQLGDIERDPEKRRELVEVYKDIFTKIQELYSGVLEEYEISKISDCINEVFDWVTREQPNVKKEVRAMCGKVLRTKIDDVYDEGKAEGKAEGRVEGKAELVRNMHSNGMSIETIAQYTKLGVDIVRKWVAATTTPVK